MEPDPRIVDAALEGDHRALGELVRSLQPSVWRVCAALGTPGEVEDLVQESFVRVLRALPSFRGECPLEIWVLTIARRVCADHVRSRDRRRRLLRRVSAGVDVVRDRDVGLWDLLAGLSVERREAFVLTQVVGLSYDEAALVIGCPLGTVRSRVARARSDLADAVRASESGT